MAHRSERRHDDRVERLEARLRAEAPDALTPAPASMRSRVLGKVWETTPDAAPTLAPVLARIGRPLLATAAVLAITAGALLTISMRSGQPAPDPRADGTTPVFLALLDEARSLGDRIPALPEQVGVNAEAERMLADVRRAAERFTRRLTPVRDVFLGERGVAPAEVEPAPVSTQG